MYRMRSVVPWTCIIIVESKGFFLVNNYSKQTMNIECGSVSVHYHNLTNVDIYFYLFYEITFIAQVIRRSYLFQRLIDILYNFSDLKFGSRTKKFFSLIWIKLHFGDKYIIFHLQILILDVKLQTSSSRVQIARAWYFYNVWIFWYLIRKSWLLGN